MGLIAACVIVAALGWRARKNIPVGVWALWGVVLALGVAQVATS